MPSDPPSCYAVVVDLAGGRRRRWTIRATSPLAAERKATQIAGEQFRQGSRGGLRAQLERWDRTRPVSVSSVTRLHPVTSHDDDHELEERR